MTKRPRDIALDAAKALWRRLPVDFRRAAAEQLLMRAAPPLPTPDPRSLADDAPRFVVGFLSSPSGLGQAARLAHTAFVARGRETFGVDLSHAFFEMGDAIAFPFADGRAHRGPGRVLININAPYMPYVFNLLGRGFLEGKHVTAYWAWETQRAPESWRKGLKFAHAFAAPSRFVADAIKTLDAKLDVIVAAHPVALEERPTIAPRTAPISATHPFVVASALNAASGFERKNPVALVRAYREAFGGRADRRLRMLVSNIEHYPTGRAELESAAAGDATIEITYAALTRADYFAWLGAPDLVASLHRAEGFGLGLAEAMLMGVPTLATDWSANAEFIDDRTGYPVRARVVPIADPQRKYEAGEGAAWAEPDHDHAVAQLRRAAEDDAHRAAVGAAAREAARARFSTFSL